MSLRESTIEKMKELGIEPKRSLGQNFLISERVVEAIFRTVDALKPQHVIEVGPGLGTLTENLIERGGRRTLVELDRKFAQYWRTRGENVIEEDALQLNWAKLPYVQESLLLSNLPYQIGGRLVIDRSVDTAGVPSMVLMFQKEVAERLTAEPRTKDYGFLSVVVQSFWKVEKVIDAGPQDFLPPPKVASRVVCLKRRRVDGLGDNFVKFVKQSFQFRRKMLSKNFKGKEKLLLEKVQELGYKSSVRGEELTVEHFQKLFFAMGGMN